MVNVVSWGGILKKIVPFDMTGISLIAATKGGVARSAGPRVATGIEGCSVDLITTNRLNSFSPQRFERAFATGDLVETRYANWKSAAETLNKRDRCICPTVGYRPVSETTSSVTTPLIENGLATNSTMAREDGAERGGDSKLERVDSLTSLNRGTHSPRSHSLVFTCGSFACGVTSRL